MNRASQHQPSGVLSKVLGYLGPGSGALLTIVAFFGPALSDPTFVRLGLEVFGTAAALGALMPPIPWRTGLLTFSSVGLLLVGIPAIGTSGPLVWFAAGLIALGVIDAFRIADDAGESLGRIPTAAAILALAFVGATGSLLG